MNAALQAEQVVEELPIDASPTSNRQYTGSRDKVIGFPIKISSALRLSGGNRKPLLLLGVMSIVVLVYALARNIESAPNTGMAAANFAIPDLGSATKPIATPAEATAQSASNPAPAAADVGKEEVIADASQTSSGLVPSTLQDALTEVSKAQLEVQRLKAELEAANAQIASMKTTGRNEGESADHPTSKAQPAHVKYVPYRPLPAKSDNLLAVAILNVNESSVTLEYEGRQINVAPGGRLPGGGTLIGFDRSRHLLHTDVGDFLVP